MKFVTRIIAAILFIVFFFFALKNTEPVELNLLGYMIRAPLVLLLLGFFAAGAVLGVLAMTPTVFRHRRDLSRHKKEIDSMRKETEIRELSRVQPPPPDSVPPDAVPNK